MKRYRTLGGTVADVLIYIVVGLVSLLCVLPLLNLLAMSFSSPAAVDAGYVTFWPVQFSVEAYKKLLAEQQFFVSFGVSVRRVIVGVSLNLLFIIGMAYPMSRDRKEFPQRPLYLAIILFVHLFGVGMIPKYMTIRSLGILDTFWCLVLPGAVSTGNLIMMMNFFRNIPGELEEAAMVDGAGPLRIMIQIYMPLSVAGIASIGLFCGVNHWNDYFSGLIYINRRSLLPLQSYVQQFVANIKVEDATSYEDLVEAALLNDRTLNAAKLFITMVPVLVVYPFLQQYFAKGIVVGAVKG